MTTGSIKSGARAVDSRGGVESREPHTRRTPESLAVQRIGQPAGKYRALVEQLPLVTYVDNLDEHSSALYMSPQIEAILGYTQEEWLADPELFPKLLHPEDRERVMSQHARAVAARAPFSSEYRLIARDGRVVWFQDEARPDFGETGRPITRGYLLDVTERKRAEEALRESEERFRTAFDDAAIGMALVATEGRLIKVNRSLCQMLGYSDQELRAKTFVEITHPADVGASLESTRAMLAGAVRSFKLEKRYLHKSGAVVWGLLSSVVVRDARNDPLYLIAQIQDITEQRHAEEKLREAEEKYRTLVEQLPLVTYVDTINEHASAIYISPQIEAILGYRREEWIDDPELFPKLIYPDDRERVLAELARTNATGEPFSQEYRVLARDGRVVWFRDEAVTERDAAGRPLHWRGYLLDITERKQLEEKLQQSQKMEAIGRLAAGIAHDFNNLLTAMVVSSEFLLEGLDDDDPLREDARQIARAADRAATLTGQLLAFSRKQMLKPTVLDLNALVDDLDTMLRRLIGEDIDLTTAPGLSLGPVKADRGQIEQVLVNLVVNARDAMPHGGRLVIETRNVDLDKPHPSEHLGCTPGPYVMIAVSDTGHGFDEKIRSSIFEPFFTTKEPGKGTGLGLATVYGIVAQSGGGIAVRSEPGLGTTFEIYLPRIAEQAPADSTGHGRSELRPGSETVLLVEDEDMVRDTVGRVLRQEGYSVLEGGTPEEAIELFEAYRGPIHLLITDVVMPQMGGRALAERLGPVRSDMKVLYMSGYTDEAIARQGVLDEGSSFIAKPFTMDALARKVRAVLGHAPEARSEAA